VVGRGGGHKRLVSRRDNAGTEPSRRLFVRKFLKKAHCAVNRLPRKSNKARVHIDFLFKMNYFNCLFKTLYEEEMKDRK
jgi:hypothetical protein